MKLIDDLKLKWIKYKSEHKSRIDNSLAFVHDSISESYYIFLESMAGNSQVIKLSLSQISKHSDDLEYFEKHLPDMVEFIKEIEPSAGKEISQDRTPLVESLDQHTKLLNITQANLFEMYLVYAVSIFEGFIKNIHYELFMKYPHTMNDKEVLTFSNSNELENVAERKASKSTSGMPEEYFKQMINRFRFDENINLLLEPFSLIIEVRNLIVHNSGRVDDRYLRRIPKSALQKGEKIQITATNVSEITETIRLYAELIEMIFVNKFPAISQINWSNKIESWQMSILDLEGKEK